MLDTNLKTEITSSYLFFFLGFLCCNNIRGTKHKQCRKNINRHIHLTQVNPWWVSWIWILCVHDVYMMSLMKLVPFVLHAVGFKAQIDENSWNGANDMQLWNEITLKKIACLKDWCKKAGMSSLSFSWELGIYYSFNFGFEHNLVWYYDMMCSFSLNAATWRKRTNTLLSIWHASSVVHKAMVAWTQFNHFQFQANNRNHP